MFEKSQIFVKSRNNLQHEQCDSIQDEDELREDAFGLLERYDDMSVEDINRFTRDDIVCALEMFNEDYVTFPRDDIAKLSGMTMPVNKRNWRKRSDHVRVMNTMKSLKKQLGEAVNLLKSQAPIKKSYRQKKSIAKQRRQNGLFGRLKQSIGDLSSFYCGKLR